MELHIINSIREDICTCDEAIMMFFVRVVATFIIPVLSTNTEFFYC